MLKDCYKCGAPADLEVEEGSAICDRCEGEYQAFLEATYPFGQCQDCGAVYNPVVCSEGRTHVVAFHSEGACGQWADYGDFGDWPGWCAYGCRPESAPVRVVFLAEHPSVNHCAGSFEDDADLPF